MVRHAHHEREKFIQIIAGSIVIGGTSTIQPVPGNATLSSCMSSDLNVATVANGLVTAVGRGDVTISCGVATVALHVRRPWVLSISPPTAELGASTTFTVTGYDLDVPLLIQIPGCAALSSGDDPISVFFTPWNVLGTTTRTLKCIAYGAAGTRTLSVRALGTPQNLANFSPPLVVSNPFPLQSTCSLQIGGCTIVVNAATGASASAATFGLFLAIRNQFGGTIPWGTLTSAQIGSVRAQLRAGGVDVSKPAYLSNAMAAELAAVDAKLNGELDAAIGAGLYSTGSIADYFNPSAWAGLANVTVKSYTAADWAKFVSGVGTNAALAVADVFPVGAALSKAARGAKLTKGTSRIAKVIYAATAIPRTAKAVRLARAVIALQPLLEAAQSAGDLWRSMDGKEDIQDAIEELASWSATSDFSPLTQFLANAKTNGRINSFDVGAVNALTNFLIHATVTMGPKMAQDGIDLATINALINAASDAVQDEIPVWGRWKSTWELSGRIAASATAPYFSGVTDMIEESGRVTTARRNFYEALNVQRIFNESSGVTGDQNVALPLLPLSAELPTEWRTMGSVQEMLIATHGWNSAADAWADDLVAALCSQRVGVTQSGTGPESGAAGAFSSGVSKWCYGGGKLFASVNWAPLAGTLGPGPAMSHAGDFGDKFADAIGNAGILPSVMHWIGHSAGSYAVQTATQNFATRSGARVVQNTYLDAYCPIPRGCDYGALADWADHYVDSGVWLTNDTLSNAFNIDITTQRPFASILPTAGHGWPYVAYTWSAGGTASYFGASRNGNVFTGIGAPLSVLQRGSQSASQWLINVSQFRPRGIRCATSSLSDPATYSATGRCSGDGVGIGAGSFLPIPSSFGSSSFSQCTVTVTASGKYLLSGCSGTASSSASVATGKLTTTAATVKATARFPITLSAAANQVRLGFRFTQPQGDAILTFFIDDVMVYTNSQARSDTVARTTGWIPISGLDIGEHSFQIVLSSQSGVFPPIEFDAPQFSLLSRQLALRFIEASMDFGMVALGASADRVVTLTNLNPQAVAAPSLSLPVVAGSFSVVSTTCTSLLSAGASCTYSLRFTPVALGISEGQLSVDTASASSSSRAILLLRGVATNAPVCDLKVAGAATVIAERDGLLLLRYMLGFRGSALVQGVTLTSAHPTAQSVELFLDPISRYDIVGRAVPAPAATVDGLILTRLMLGVADTSLLNGITLPAGVQFATAAAIRANVIAKCAGGF